MYFKKEKAYLTASYVRLSREDGDKVESDSIHNQRELICDFVKKHDDLKLVEEYIDDGYSGTNFDRPAFMRMIEDAKRKKIDCIIVKDLSRLGRNYIETGKYIEKIFPFMGIRFIAINDHYDSADEESDADHIIIPCQVKLMRIEQQFALIMAQVEDQKTAFSRINPWLALYRQIEVPDELERSHIMQWVDRVAVVDAQTIEVGLKQQEWKYKLPQEWLTLRRDG